MKSIIAVDVLGGIAVALPTMAIDESLRRDAISALNETNGLPHGGSHENGVSFGILFTTGENGYTAEIFAETENGLHGFIPLNII